MVVLIIEAMLGILLTETALVSYIPTPEYMCELTFLSNLLGGVLFLVDALFRFLRLKDTANVEADDRCESKAASLSPVPGILFLIHNTTLSLVFIVTVGGTLSGLAHFNFDGGFFMLHAVNPILVMVFYLVAIGREKRSFRELLWSPAMMCAFLVWDYARYLVCGKPIYGIFPEEGMHFPWQLVILIATYAAAFAWAAFIYFLGRRKHTRAVVKWVGIVLGSICVIAAAVIFVSREVTEGKYSVKSPDGIEEELYVEACGQKLYCLVRGENRDNPVIVWVHGGPASPDTMMTYFFSSFLKDDYTVLAFNQRGCGRSFLANRDVDPGNDSATFEQAQQDLDAIVDYARERFGKDKVYIVGHSYGTMVGSRYVIDHPDKVIAYVGVGQMGEAGGVSCAYKDAYEQARTLGDDTTELEAVYAEYCEADNVTNLLRLRALMDKYHAPEKSSNYILSSIASPYMGIDDIKWFARQIGPFEKFERINRNLFDYISEHDVYEYGTEFKVPVGIMSGSCDWTTPVVCAKQYYETVTAPKKCMRLIDGWGHTVPMEAPEEFAQALREVLTELSK